MTVSLAGLVDKQKLFIHVFNDLVKLSSVFDKLSHLRKVLLAMTQESLLESGYVPRKLPDEFLDFGGSLGPIFCLKV